MSGEQYGPKLIEESKYDSVCALCANEIPKGSPLWWFNKNCYCMEHSKAEIRTEAGRVSSPNDCDPTPSAGPSALTIRFDLPEMKMFQEISDTLDRLDAAITQQTEVLKGMRKDNNERR